jgi:hypothetical protein
MGPVSLVSVLVVSPSPAVPFPLMPLPSRSTSADLPVDLDTALLHCFFLLPAAKETRSGCLCPGDCAPRAKSLWRGLVHTGRPLGAPECL